MAIEKDFGIYIHIPFCKAKCKYCDFVSFTNSLNQMDAYIEGVIGEMQLYSKSIANREISSLFIGGGTPSLVEKKQLKRLFDGLKANFNVKSNAEISIEGNPESLSYDFLEGAINLGINRLSIGVQSLNDDLLKSIGRIHSSVDYFEAVRCAYAVGFTNINADVMIGLNGQTLNDTMQTLDKIIDSRVTHISAYALRIEKGTPMYLSQKKGLLNQIDDDLTADMYDATVEKLEFCGYNRYEVSNFSKNGFECKHNLNYWERGEYLGLGIAAHSHIDNVRFYNTKKLSDYIQKIKNGEKPLISSKKTTKNQIKWEFLMLGLRKIQGVSISQYNQLFKSDLLNEYANSIKKLTELGLLLIENDCFFVEKSKFYLLNSILCELEPN